MKKIVSLTVLVALLLVGCTTATMVTIETNAENTDVYVDGTYLGETPVTMEMSNLFTEDPTIVLEKEGYATAQKKTEKEIKVLNLVSGFFFYIPWLWCYGPQENQFFHLTEK